VPDYTLEVQVGLAEILGLLAIVAAILIWRGPEFTRMQAQLRLLTAYEETGLAPKKIRALRYKMIARILLLTVGTFGAFNVFWFTFHYIDVVHRLVQNAATGTMGMFSRLQSHAETDKSYLVLLAFVVSSIFILEWLASLFLSSPLGELTPQAIPTAIHSHIIPSDEILAFSPFWEDRIAASARILKSCPALRQSLEYALKTGEWQQDWPTWTTCVVAHRLAVSNPRLAEQKR